MIIEFLGTGTSHGVPVVGCTCPVCTSSDKRDQRYRASLYIQSTTGETVVIDTGPEFRLQAIRAHIQRLDAILLTHAHADHLHGLDDIRPLSCQRPLPVYGNRPTITEMKERFSYVFRETQIGGGKPQIIPIIVSTENNEENNKSCTSDSQDLAQQDPDLNLKRGLDPIHHITLGNLIIYPIPVFHGRLSILGWLIEEQHYRIAYLTDVSSIPPASYAMLDNLDILIIGALRKRPHPTHFSFDEAFEIIRQLKPQQVFLTHLCHDYSHSAVETYIQEQGFGLDRVAPAYDGLKLSLP
ncbi:MBL fold metallo-hydrolase [Gracilinema caldarium]|uniref:Beta-lactamase domain protein n=1 Tax=Gracilinema caldarium (strain ATCC 51460 / DSM 7334 / H1) TaxID=744872 RepID=F8F450_GRAC1|nr:MBL fold metallo-hydrolase [Gracilinema caldarium]AEJ20069.1 beta-lactamase domain protein [Gracilinema caldarium DSM 7334]